MNNNNFSFEVIFINDGSRDNSWKVIEELAQKSPHVKGIKFRRNYGKSPALYCGFKEAQGDVVITMDADLQDSPNEIPELYRMILKKVTTWCRVTKRNATTHSLKPFLPSSLMQQLAR